MSQTTERPTATKPPLKWAGGKRWLVPRLKELWSGKGTLTEPFVGGGSVALGLRPSIAVLNDLNPHLINFWQQVQTTGLVKDMEYVNEEDYYYCVRSEFNQRIADGYALDREMAQMFYYLNRTGFNGLCRFNKRGFYNVPFGKYKTINYAEDFHDLAEQIQHWDFKTACFEHTLMGRKYDKGDLVYADPPYHHTFDGYTGSGFDWAAQEQLAYQLYCIAETNPCLVIASNSNTPEIVKLYTDLGFAVEEIQAPRRIAANGDRQPATEILAIKQV